MGICFLGFSQSKNSDYSIKGLILDSLGVPIYYAQVSLLDMEKHILSYGFTDSNGVFFVNYKTNSDSIILNINRLGFKSKSLKLNRRTNNIKIKLLVSKVLSEIVVKAKVDIPMRLVRDTITYSANSFMNGTEVNVEDVLKKLPGVEVDENTGMIKFQGKEIKKILLDGDDLTSTNYKVLSKNLSAEWLDKIELLSNYTDNRLYKGIKKTNDVAINLKLKKSVKARVFGKVFAGLGTLNKYTSKLELLSYKSKIKLFGIGVSNNTGEEIEIYNLETYLNKNFKYENFINSKSILAELPTVPSYLNPKSFTFHKGSFISNSFVFKPTSKLKINSFTTLYKNSIHANLIDDSFYPFVNIKRKVTTKQNPFELFQKLKFSYKFSNDADLISKFSVATSNKKKVSFNQTKFSTQNTISNNNLTSIYSNIDYIIKKNSKWVSKTGFHFNAENREDKLKFNYLNNEPDSLVQIYKQNLLNIGLVNEINGNISKTLNFNSLTGISNTTFQSESVIKVINQFSGFENKYYLTNVFFDANVKKKINKLKLFGGVRFRKIFIKFNDKKYNKFVYEPSIGFSIKNVFFSRIETKMKGFYNKKYNFIDPTFLYSNFLLESFDSSTRYIVSPIEPGSSDVFMFSLNVFDFGNSYLSGNVGVIYTKSTNSLVDNFDVINGFVKNTQIRGGINSLLSTNFTLSKYFAKLKVNVKTVFRFNKNFVPLILNNNNNNNNNNNGISQLYNEELGFTVGKRLLKKTSISLAYSNNFSSNYWNNEEVNFSYQNYFIKLNYSKASRFSISSSLQMIKFDYENKLHAMLNGKFDYSFKNKKLFLEIKINNSLNKKNLTIKSIYPFFYSQRKYPLVKRFLFLTLKYKF